MNCANCEHNDGMVYTSFPPKYKCTITNEFHFGDDDCNVEFAPVKHGRWIKSKKSDYNWECSNCGYGLTDYRTTYCYDCGARMDENGEDSSHPFAESVMMGMGGEEND